MWLGVAGIILFAVVLATVIFGISAATIVEDDPAADARAAQFDQCYNGGANCVADGDTIYVAGEKVVIAGIAAPRIQDANCSDERSRGIDTAVRLANLLNSGTVTLGTAFRDPYGRRVRDVQVRGEDVAQRLLNDGLAREYTGERPNYCD